MGASEPTGFGGKKAKLVSTMDANVFVDASVLKTLSPLELQSRLKKIGTNKEFGSMTFLTQVYLERK